jgi:prepilin signal peptidase PulO-like enzyme (type II secretory pathway)
MFALEVVGVTLFGMIVGSFVNVLVLRFGFAETARDRSACMSCQAPLSWTDLVPVLSYLALSGRCRICGSAISLQYPLVELGMGALFLMSFLMTPAFGSVWQYAGFAAMLVFWASFMLILVIDLRHTLVPLRFAYALIAAAALVRAAQALYVGGLAPLGDGALGAAAFGGFIALVVYLTHGKGMGAGDIYIAAAIGLLFGLVRGVEVAALSFWIGAAVGIVLMLVKKGVRMKTELPFAPFMFVAALAGAFMRLW